MADSTCVASMVDRTDKSRTMFDVADRDLKVQYLLKGVITFVRDWLFDDLCRHMFGSVSMEKG